ncbi:protein lifeguard 1-like [Ylistrum balloti]|uniref:protein lifeguard 1-like n=1 Tax=Ylistrum balloti TaxID=509963 RepID=UPI00290591D8|nr:protein lifeguard 1-like [Ylistrum balloti]
MNDDDSTQGFNMGDNFAFSEKTIRMGFIRKVYGILLCQILVTILFICLFLYAPAVQNFAAVNPWLWYVAIVLTFIMIIALACCPDVRRQSPLNMILLAIFTVCEGFLLGGVAGTYNENAVLMAVGVTAIVTFALTVFAFQTKIDFTMMGGLLFVFLIVLICFGFLCAIIQNEYARLAYSCLGALLFSAYIVFDTQMMIGGKHKYSLSPEEYIFAALNLYLDIVNLFLFLLSIFGSRN